MEEEAADSSDELQYDEEASIDESSASGSEFELSSDDSIAGSQDEDDITSEVELRTFAEALQEEGVDAEDVLMDFAVQESLLAAQKDRTVANGHSSAGAGSSNATKTRDAAAALRAAAAERRLSRTKSGSLDEDFDIQEEIIEISDDSADEQPLSKNKGKGKGKATVRQQSQTVTLNDLKAKGRESRRNARLRKAQERELAAELGRKLTQVIKHLYQDCRDSYLHSSRLKRTPSLSVIITLSFRTFGGTLSARYQSLFLRKLLSLLGSRLLSFHSNKRVYSG